jgi:cleavage and polyadenylation specificity factor subunit 2
VTSTLRNGGNVLLPVDSAQRSLELSLVLESKWRSDRNMRTYPLIFLSTMAYRTFEFASHQLEWMSDIVMKGFDERRENPFEFKHMRMFDSITAMTSEMDKIMKGPIPMVVLATYNSLETGFARELLVKWANDPKNLILTTGNFLLMLFIYIADRSSPSSLARKIIDCKLQNESTSNLTLPMTIHRRVPLTGRELIEYEQNKLKQKQQKREQERMMQLRDMDEQMEDEGEVFVDTLRLPHDADDEYGDRNELKEIKRHVRETQKRKNRMLLAESGVDMSGGLKSPIAHSAAQSHDRLFLPENMRYYSLHLMFPCIERNYEYDEYGERVDVNELKNRSLQLYEEDMNRLNEGNKVMDKKPEQEQEQEEIPTKSVSENIIVHLLSRLEFVNFEGRADALSVRNILRQIGPRKIVLVHGDKNATKELQTFCIEHKISETVEAPAFQQTIDVTIDTNMFQVRLEPELFVLNPNPFIPHEAYELMYVEGKYVLSESEQHRREGVTDDVLLDEEMDEENMPAITADPRGHDSVLIGDVRLNQFYDVLVRNGFKPEFRTGGCLVCGQNESVMLRRDADTGTIVVEGSVCIDYLRVRKLLYDMYKFI